MAYTPSTWETGDVIDAAGLNKMEDGIAAAAQAKMALIGYDEENEVYTCTMTCAEIKAAIEAGEPVLVYSYAFPLTGGVVFSSPAVSGTSVVAYAVKQPAGTVYPITITQDDEIAIEEPSSHS